MHFYAIYEKFKCIAFVFITMIKKRLIQFIKLEQIRYLIERISLERITLQYHFNGEKDFQKETVGHVFFLFFFSSSNFLLARD